MITYDQMVQLAGELREDIIILIESFEDKTDFEVTAVEIKPDGLYITITRSFDIAMKKIQAEMAKGTTCGVLYEFEDE